jgi:predicted DNA-binding WGR domain protein
MLRWEKGTRYYQAAISRDLFGVVVVKRWGRIGTRLGRMELIPCPDRDRAISELAAITKRRKARGYRLVSADSLD